MLETLERVWKGTCCRWDGKGEKKIERRIESSAWAPMIALRLSGTPRSYAPCNRTPWSSAYRSSATRPWTARFAASPQGLSWWRFNVRHVDNWSGCEAESLLYILSHDVITVKPSQGALCWCRLTVCAACHTPSCIFSLGTWCTCLLTPPDPV